MPQYTQRPVLMQEYFNSDVELPYKLTIEEVKATINAVYDFLHDVNIFLVERGYSRLEDLLLGNTFAGILSEILIKNLSNYSATMVGNTRVGGYPDLIPRGVYLDDSTLQGTEGIEIKVSKQRGGWQGHNPEAGWVMVFRYIVDTETLPVENRAPTEIVEVLAAKLELEEWNFSGRKGTSRRTITASINRRGMEKLRANPIYRHPDYAVGMRRRE
ncbi:hypothetical protein FJZ31_26195 [Candidatus Poribacteria bacterium]|nr:hypothetical protein [Candidatus Poribacteria bacterium]